MFNEACLLAVTWALPVGVVGAPRQSVTSKHLQIARCGAIMLHMEQLVETAAEDRVWPEPIALPRKYNGFLLLIIVLALGTSGWILYSWLHPTPPPVTSTAAGLNGQTWVMQSGDVVPFLKSHGVDAQVPPLSGTFVVGRVAWKPLPLGTDTRFTVILGDELPRAGDIFATYGLPTSQVALGGGSMWDKTLSKSRWLEGDRTFLSDQGWTSNAGFASVLASWRGNVWFVARVIDNKARDEFGQSLVVSNPKPVLVVALNTGDHVWWSKRVN